MALSSIVRGGVATTTSVLCVLLCVLPVRAQPTQRIYVANDDHTDYFWTADEATYRDAFIRMLDYYLDRADATSDRPSHEQARFVCDGYLWMWEYEQAKSRAEFQRLVDRIADGHISVPLNVLSLSQGGAPIEAILRGMYYPGRIERRFPGTRFPLALSVENPTFPLGLGSLWAGAGAKYTWTGNWGGDTVIPRSELADRGREIYWWVGRDGSRLLIKWNSLFDGASLGGYAEARSPDTAVSLLLGNTTFNSRWPYPLVKGAFGKGWDDLQTLTDEFETVARSRTSLPDLKVVVSNEVDFFEDFEATYGDELPSYTASFGNEWDLYPATLAEVTARLKRAVEKLRAAEALACLVGMYDPALSAGTTAQRDRAFLNLGLYWEHDFNMLAKGAASMQRRIDFQRRLVAEIEDYVETLHEGATEALGERVRRSGDRLRFFAFNSLDGPRTGIVELAYDGALPIHVVDLATGQTVPSQIIETTEHPRRLRIEAPNVPAVGYKVFEARPGEDGGFTGSPQVDLAKGLIENDFYRVTVSGSGAISSIVDKRRGNRELVRQGQGRLVNDIGSTSGTLSVGTAGPVCAALKAVASDGLAHTTIVTLYRSIPRIDVQNEITEGFDATPVWTFAFQLESADVWHEECGAILLARRLAEGGHYAPRCARVDWLTMNHFADVTAGDFGITLANADCLFFKLGESTPSYLDASSANLHVLAGGRVGGDRDSGIRDQGGDTRFLQRFSLATHGRFSAEAAMRMSLESQNPLVAGRITGESPTFPEDEYSLVHVEGTGIVLWALKPADSGIADGVVARVWNLSESSSSLRLSLAPGIETAQRTTHIETPINDAPVMAGSLEATLKAQELATFQLRPAATAAPPRIDAIEPQSGAPGDRIRIEGTGFGLSPEVYFGEANTTPTAVDSTGDLSSLQVAVPGNAGAGSVDVTVRDHLDRSSNSVPFEIVPAFVRGDGNLDQIVDVSDAVTILLHLFLGSSVSCRDALDCNDDGRVDVTDAVRLLVYLFRSGHLPPAPFPAPGTDPTEDPLDCSLVS